MASTRVSPAPHHTRGADLILQVTLEPRLGLQRIAAERQIADLTCSTVLAAHQPGH